MIDCKPPLPCKHCGNDSARKFGYKLKSGGFRYQQFQCMKCHRIYLGGLVVEHKPKLSLDERFWEKVEKTESCWNWLASKGKGGYGLFKVDNNMVLAHRYAYTQLKGPIPEGYTLDHRCVNPSCVNPSHLEAVTLQENILRSRNLSNSPIIREEL